MTTVQRWRAPLLAAAMVVTCTSMGLAQTGQAATPTEEWTQTDESTGGGQYAEINGARLYYEVTGQGQPLILIHGYPLNGRLFREQRRGLSQSFQVITLDLRGFGRSTAPNGVASIALYARDVLGLMDHLGLSQAIVGGHSMGGVTTLEIVKQAPERVRGLVLIDTTAMAAAIFERSLWLGYAVQARQVGVASFVPSIVPELLTGQARVSRPGLVRFTERLVQQTSVNGATGGAIALATRPDYTDLLPAIAVPAVVIEGLEDTVTPLGLAQQLDAGIPNSDLVVIRGASHAANLEQGARVNKAILDWATRQGLR